MQEPWQTIFACYCRFMENTQFVEYVSPPGMIDALARRLDVALSTVYRWKKGARLPTPAMRRRIAKATRGAVAAESWR